MKILWRKINLMFYIIFYLLFYSWIYSFLLGPGIWEYGDMMFPPNVDQLRIWEKLTTHAWFDQEFLGFSVVTDQGVPRISYVLILELLYAIIGNPSLVQYFWWVIMSTIASIAMYYMVQQLLRDSLASFLSSILYGLNPWLIDSMAFPLIIQAYAFSPLLILAFIKLLHSNHYIKKIFYAYIFTCTYFFIMVSVHMVWLNIILLSIYIIFYILSTKVSISSIKNIILSLSILSISMISILSFYILPSVIVLLKGSPSIVDAYSRFASPSVGSFYGADLTVVNVIRQLGFHDSRFKGNVLGSSLSLAPPPGWTFLSFVIPLLWTVPLINFKRHAKNTKLIIMYFYIILLIGIFLASSPKIMDGVLFNIVLYRLPLMNDPHYYGYLISYSNSVITGYALSIILQKVIYTKKIKNNAYIKFIISLLVFLIILFNIYLNYPIFYLHVLHIYDFRFLEISYPPIEYSDVANYINSHSSDDYRILILPPVVSIKHNWAPYFYYFSLDVYLFNPSSYGRWILEATPSMSINFSSLVNYLLMNYLTDKVAKILSLAATSRIIVFNDTESMYPYISNPKTYLYLNTLFKQQGIQLEKQINNIYIFRVQNNLTLPHIYATNFVLLTNLTIENALLFSELTYNFNDTIAILNTNRTLPCITSYFINWNNVVDISFSNKSLKDMRRFVEIFGARNWNETKEGLIYNTSLPIPSKYIINLYLNRSYYMIKVNSSVFTKQGLIGVIFGFKDNDNWYSVELRGYQDSVAIVQSVNGTLKVLAITKYNVIPKINYEILIKVVGNLVHVYINDNKVLTVTLSSFATGKIGLMGYIGKVVYYNLSLLEPYLIKSNIIFDCNSNRNLNTINRTTLNYKKISPALYIVHVRATKPFLLVFSESYNPLWHAYIISSDISMENKNIISYMFILFNIIFINKHSINTHIIVNGYANAFYVNRTGDLYIAVLYEPEIYLYIGYLISAVSFSIYTIFLFKFIILKIPQSLRIFYKTKRLPSI